MVSHQLMHERIPAGRIDSSSALPILFNLESLRGISALMVAVFHIQWLTSLQKSPLIQNAYVFVDFFFVLSGFIIALNYSARGSGSFDARGFMIKRFFRLYPLHIATALAFLMLILAKQFLLPAFTPLKPRGALPHDYATSVILNMLMLNAGNDPHRDVLNVPSWSIAAEFWTYCVFCICCIATRRPAMRIGLMAGVGVLSFLALLPLAGDGGLATAPRMLRCLSAFGLGASVYAVVAWLPHRLGGLRVDLAFIALLGMLYLLLGDSNNQTPINILALPLFAAIIWLSAVDQGSWTRRILELSPFRALGRWSYSIYMVHFILATIIGVLLEFGHFTRVDLGNIHSLMVLPSAWGDVLLVCYLGVVVVISKFTYQWIERPWREKGRALAAGQGAKPEEAALGVGGATGETL